MVVNLELQPCSGSNSPPAKCCAETKKILLSIQTQLTGFDTRLSLIEVLHEEIQALRHSLEFSQEQIDNLQKENKILTSSVQSLTTQLSTTTAELKTIKSNILDIESRSMRDNLIFSGIPEQNNENAEATIRTFMTTQLKLPADTVQFISFHRVHRIQSRNNQIRTLQTKRTGSTSRKTSERHQLRTQRSIPKRNTPTPQAAIPHPQTNDKRR